MGRLTANTAAWLEPDRHWPNFHGVICQQFHADMIRYANVIDELSPPFVIEIGRAHGGTAMWLAAHVGDGLVISIDVKPATVDHPKLLCIEGSSTAEDTLSRIHQLTGDARGLVLLDGDHDHRHVERELDIYAPLADYLVVEDTIMGDLVGMEDNGPHMALGRWLPAHPEFEADMDPFPTQHPGGWLRRVD